MNKFAVVITDACLDATGKKSSNANGTYFFFGMKDDMPFYRNWANQYYLYYASKSCWYVSDMIDFEENENGDWCLCTEMGFGHPLRAHQ